MKKLKKILEKKMQKEIIKNKEIKIIFTRGMQASGKSWWAKDFIKKNQNFKRVSRDSIRHMLSDYTFDKKNEKLVTIIENIIIENILDEGYNLVLDNMHLNKEKLEERKKWMKGYCEIKFKCQVEFEVKNFPVTLEEALTRDKIREFSLGEKVLKGTWNRYKNELIEMLEESKPKVEYNPDLPDVVCFDVDGTLFNRKNRSPFDFTKVKEDEPVEIVFEQNVLFRPRSSELIFKGRNRPNFWRKSEYNVPLIIPEINL